MAPLRAVEGGRVTLRGHGFPVDKLPDISVGDQPARVQPLPVATLRWKSLSFEFLAPESARTSLEAALGELRSAADQTVVRVTFTGTTSPKLLGETRTWLDATLAPFLVRQVVDRTRIALSAPELAELKSRHPILAQTLADIDRLESLATGAIPPSGDLSPADVPALTLAEAQALLGPAKIELSQLTPEFFSQLRHVLLQTLQEVTT